MTSCNASASASLTTTITSSPETSTPTAFTLPYSSFSAVLLIAADYKQPATMAAPSRVNPTTTTFLSLPLALVSNSAASTVTPYTSRDVATQLATAHRPSLLPVSAPMFGTLAKFATTLHSSLTHTNPSSVPLFSSADLSPAASTPYQISAPFISFHFLTPHHR